MTCYTLDSTAGVWPQQENLLLPGTYSHTWVVMIVDCGLSDYVLLTDDGRLFLSLYSDLVLCI